MFRRYGYLPGVWLLLLCAGAGPSTRSASVEARDVGGEVRRPLELAGAKAAVVIFISADCPICNGYAPEINRICAEYEPKHVAFYLVHCDPALSAEDAKKHAKEFGFTCPVLMDQRRELADRVGATMTPEAAVIGADGVVLYRGRIDDLYVALGKKRFEATTHDLRAALDAVLAGRKVPTPRTTAIGCAIAGK
jgi:thiol-disulfide isomerase/thioredoxin